MTVPKTLGKYQIESFLGMGASAEVYKALDTTLKRIVALKVLKSALVADEEAFARFTQEAQTLASLVHPQIAWVWDLGEADGRYFIAMRYVDGQSLDKVIAERGALPWEETLKITEQVASSLEFAHDKGLVHRDVKPQNIMIGKSEGAVLTDFGLVKALHSSGMTSTTSMIGTPSYIAPEIWEGEEASPASDQYALASVITEMLTGRVLFGGTTPAIMKKHLLEPPSLPEKPPEGFPNGILIALQRALGKNPVGRYASVKQFVSELETPLKIAPSHLPENSKHLAKKKLPNSRKEKQEILNNSETTKELMQNIKTGPIPVRIEKKQPVQKRPPTRQNQGQKLLTLAPGVKMVFMRVPAGKFIMGSEVAAADEKPQHKVYLGEYWIGKVPVTNAQFLAFAESASYPFPHHWNNGKIKEGKENHPVVNVNWLDSQEYCSWLSEITGENIQLPTEAEWEKASRGVDGRKYPWGDLEPDENNCNFSTSIFGRGTSPVGQYSPGGDSTYGCEDMAGNVWEWVNDWYRPDYYQKSPASNPKGPSEGIYRVMRGGSWKSSEDGVRSSRRSCRSPGDVDHYLGFRCICRIKK
jgi:serine/threonine-protein kinase